MSRDEQGIFLPGGGAAGATSLAETDQCAFASPDDDDDDMRTATSGGPTPPRSVSLSFDGQDDDDDRSELTSWTARSGDDGAVRRGSSDETGEKTPEGEFSIARLIGDRPSGIVLPGRKAYDDDDDDGAADASSQRVQYSVAADQTLVDYVSLREKQRKELNTMEAKVGRQKERIDVLTTRLKQSRAECEVLKAERAGLVEELARERAAGRAGGAAEQQSLASSSTSKKGFSIPFSIGAGAAGGQQQPGPAASGGSMQMLLDVNSKIMAENARLQVSEDNLRKSFQSHVRYFARSSQADNEAAEALRRRVAELERQLGESPKGVKKLAAAPPGDGDDSPPSGPLSDRKLSWSEHTELTERTSTDGLHDTSHRSREHSCEESLPLNSLHSIPEQKDVVAFGSSGDDWASRGEEEEEPEEATKSVVRGRRSSDSMLDLSDRERQRLSRSLSDADGQGFFHYSPRGRYKAAERHKFSRSLSDPDKTGPYRFGTSDLLVDFGEFPRRRGFRRRSPSPDAGGVPLPTLIGDPLLPSLHSAPEARARPSRAADGRKTNVGIGGRAAGAAPWYLRKDSPWCLVPDKMLRSSRGEADAKKRPPYERSSSLPGRKREEEEGEEEVEDIAHSDSGETEVRSNRSPEGSPAKGEEGADDGRGGLDGVPEVVEGIDASPGIPGRLTPEALLVDFGERDRESPQRAGSDSQIQAGEREEEGAQRPEGRARKKWASLILNRSQHTV